MKYWNPETEIVENRGDVVIANHMNGSWMRISEETFGVVECLRKIQDGDRVEFEDKEDKVYLAFIMKFLEHTKALIEEEKIFVPNKTVSIEMTHRCNLHCVHCCVDADHSQKSGELDTEEMKAILKKSAAWNPRSIMLSGGEPLLRKDFEELLCYLRKIYLGKIIVSTNGTLVTEENANILAKNADQIDLSVDGVDEETTAKVRGSGVFDKVMRAIKKLQENGFTNLSLSMAMADRNEYLEERFDQLCEKIKVRPVKRKFSPVGRGEKSKELFSEKTEKESYVPKSFKKDTLQKEFGVCSCSAGKRELFISHDGTVYPCPSFICGECNMGNIRETDCLEELIARSKIDIRSLLKEKLWEFSENRCENCKVRLFCWTCPGQITEIRTKEAFDDRCRQVQSIYEKRVWGNKNYELHDMDNNRLQPAL